MHDYFVQTHARARLQTLRAEADAERLARRARTPPPETDESLTPARSPSRPGRWPATPALVIPRLARGGRRAGRR